ncbi:MAG: hypothetical protein ACREIV_14395 [Planctomycetaceae bacterium]
MRAFCLGAGVCVLSAAALPAQDLHPAFAPVPAESPAGPVDEAAFVLPERLALQHVPPRRTSSDGFLPRSSVLDDSGIHRTQQSVRAQQLIYERAVERARQRSARIELRKWSGASLLRPVLGQDRRQVDWDAVLFYYGPAVPVYAH